MKTITILTGLLLTMSFISCEHKMKESERLQMEYDKHKAENEALSKARQSEISVMEAELELMKAKKR